MTRVNTSDLLPMVEQEAIRQGVDPDTAKAIMLSENSYFDRGGNLIRKSSVGTDTVSPMNAQGIMQVIPSTAAALVRKGFVPPTIDFNSPEGQIKLGVAAIKELNSRGITNPSEVAVGYNGSPTVLEQYRAGKSMNPETTDYLKKFSAHYTGSAVPMASPESDQQDQTFQSQATPGSSTSQRISISESKHQLPPGAAEDLVAKQKTFAELSTNLQAQLVKLSSDILGGAGTLGTAATEAGQAKAESIAAKAREDIITNQSLNQAASAYGVNLNTDPDVVIGRNMRIVSDARDKRIDLQEQIAQLRSTGGSPLTDPIGWLVNSVRQLPLIAQHNALAIKENNAANNISLAQGLAKQQASFQPAALSEAINTKGIADAKVAISEATLQKQQFEQAARAHVAQFVIEQSKLAGHDLSTTLDVDRLLGVSTTTTTAISEKEKTEDDQMRPIRLAAQSLGLDPTIMTKTGFKSMSPELQNKWIQIGSQGRLGISPGDAIATLNATYGTSLKDINKNVPAAGAFLQNAVNQGITEQNLLEQYAIADPKIAFKLKSAKTPNDRLALGVDTWVAKKEAEANPEKSDFAKLPSDNPYKINYGYASKQPELADNPYAKLVRDTPKGITVNEQLLLASAVGDINSSTKPKSPAQAAQELYDYYSKGMARQVSDTRMETFGFKPKDSYPVMAKVGTFTAQPVDMLNRASIERYLIQQAVASRAITEYGQYMFAPGSMGEIPVPLMEK